MLCVISVITRNILKQPNNYFNSWFIDNKLNIYFGEDNISSITFGSKRKLISLNKLNINMVIQDNSTQELTYLGVHVWRAIHLCIGTKLLHDKSALQYPYPTPFKFCMIPKP